MGNLLARGKKQSTINVVSYHRFTVTSLPLLIIAKIIDMSCVTSFQNGFCHFKKENVGATDTGYVDIPHMQEDKLQEAVATIGPISVAIDAGHKSFQLYREGVYSEPACSSSRLDHGVLAVGYGTESGDDYWLVKNRYDAISFRKLILKPYKSESNANS